MMEGDGGQRRVVFLGPGLQELETIAVDNRCMVLPLEQNAATLYAPYDPDADEALAVELPGTSPHEAAMVSSAAIAALSRRRVPVLCLFDAMRFGDDPPPPIRDVKALSTGLVAIRGYTSDDEKREEFHRWVERPAIMGKLFVVEGGDGVGKQTQSAMLRERLAEVGYPVTGMYFPLDDGVHGTLIRRVLEARVGGHSLVHPLLFASLYAENRCGEGPLLMHWLRCGYNVVLDRYVSANLGHQAARVTGGDAAVDQAVRSLIAFEHDWLRLPRPYRVVLLDLPPRVALAAMEADTARASLDVQEASGDAYKNAVRAVFRRCADLFDDWVLLDCGAQGEDGSRPSPEEVHERIWDALWPHFVNKGHSVVA